MSRYKITTVSISKLFNPSFFTKHKCIKDNLTENNISTIPLGDFDHFDFIILNSTLTFDTTPNNTLNLIEKLCNNKTIVFSTHYEINWNMPSTYFINFDKDINNLFNTNSLKLLCDKHNFVLSHKYNNERKSSNNESNNEPILYEFKLKTYNHQVSTDIIEHLYNEITLEVYDETTYKMLAFLNYYSFHNFNDILKKYRCNNYKIIAIDINNKQIILNVDCHINKNDSLHFLNDDKDNKYLFVIFDNFEYISLYLKTQLIKCKINLSKCLLFDTRDLLCHPILN